LALVWPQAFKTPQQDVFKHQTSALISMRQHAIEWQNHLLNIGVKIRQLRTARLTHAAQRYGFRG
jgi:hypothetical protein